MLDSAERATVVVLWRCLAQTASLARAQREQCVTGNVKDWNHVDFEPTCHRFPGVVGRTSSAWRARLVALGAITELGAGHRRRRPSLSGRRRPFGRPSSGPGQSTELPVRDMALAGGPAAASNGIVRWRVVVAGPDWVGPKRPTGARGRERIECGTRRGRRIRALRRLKNSSKRSNRSAMSRSTRTGRRCGARSTRTG
jgi:hypothetical protein